MERGRKAVEEYLAQRLPPEGEDPSVLHRAIRYAVFSGGKRIRPFLVLESCRTVGGEERRAVPAAAAVELIHTYSLVHDDLPSIDNDDFRRGQPTCHRVFGEAYAVLCGDALQALAFEILSTDLVERGVSSQRALMIVRELAVASGPQGLVGGQVLDLQGEDGLPLREESVRRIHERKTAALICACCRIGGIIGGAGQAELDALTEYGRWLGLAFQIWDDLLDAIGDPDKLGKTVRKDASQGKLTYPRVVGPETARERARQACESAIQALELMGERGQGLRDLAWFVVARDR